MYILNRLPSKAIDSRTQNKLWYGSKPSITHLKVFGNVCYMHVPEVKMSEQDKKTNINILLSYSLVSKGYGIYDLFRK